MVYGEGTQLGKRNILIISGNNNSIQLQNKERSEPMRPQSNGVTVLLCHHHSTGKVHYLLINGFPAINLIEERKGVKLAAYTYNGMNEGFCKDANFVVVKRWYGKIVKNDLRSDQVVLFMAVPFVVTQVILGLPLSCAGLFRAVLGQNNFGRKEIFQRVVDGLVKELDIDKAKELVELVKSFILSCFYTSFLLTSFFGM